ncbi:WD domain, G-beta repeat-containing protein [Besnoitia besnoiti]|uniref:WD domain, G-beta repeat-containing protein n=1 Tax=Besnoitia besnoiti TaxID=94643 RepID=A0A2A9M817_BESBE|nr:WD domain, G-beta repeat-containing protein [Besnoitia besnoiti]PFH34135.1 WD domain, G-beta repeat-containing protein [Besnoitia besnoiti]
MSLKEVCRSACIAWGPPSGGSAHAKWMAASDDTSSGPSSHQLYLALGTMGLDPHLELAAVDFASSSSALPVVASVSAASPFQCIAWDSSGQNKAAGGEQGSGASVGDRVFGLIAGGMADGDVTLWDAEVILRAGASSGAESSSFGNGASTNGAAAGGSAGLLASVSVHRNQRVHCIHFNPSRPSLLAAGGSSGSVSILDVENVYDVAVYEPGGEQQGVNSGSSGDECTSLAWNRVVPHVLATSFGSGSTSVWDLKQRKTAISFCDPTHRQCRPSSIVWLPNQATQLLLAYDDDRHPVLQLWDLRNSSYPLRETASDGVYGHTRGIVHAALNPMDSRMLLTSGRDNRIVCWWLEEDAFHTQGHASQGGASSGFGVYMQQQTQQPYVQLQWAPSSTPGVFAAAAPIRVCIKGLGSGGFGGFGEEIAFFGPNSTSVVCAALGAPPPSVASTSGSEGDAVGPSDEERDLRARQEEWKAEENAFQQEALALDAHLQRGDWQQACEEELQRLGVDPTAPPGDAPGTDPEKRMNEKVWKLLARLFQQPRSSALVEAFTMPKSEVAARVEAFLGRPLPSTLKKRQEAAHGQAPPVGASMPAQLNAGTAFFGAPQVNGVGPQPPAFHQEEVDPEKFFSQLGSSSEEEKRPHQAVEPNSESGEGASEGQLSAGQPPAAEAAEAPKPSEDEQGKAPSPTPPAYRLGSSHTGPIDWSSEVGSLVRACLLCGCLEGAVELLQSYGSEADALLLAGAASGAGCGGGQAARGTTTSVAAAAGAEGAALWTSACQAYIEKMQDPFMKLVGYVILEDFPGLIAAVSSSAPATRGAETWRDALALLYCYAPDGGQLASLCRQLGDRLSADGENVFGALFCYFCAGDFAGACRIWRHDLQLRLEKKDVSSAADGKQTKSRSAWLGYYLLATVKRMLILRAALRYEQPCAEFEEIAVAYASSLASDATLAVPAMRLLVFACGVGARGAQGERKGAAGAAAPEDPQAAAASLAFRLFHSQPEQMQRHGFFPPPSPFEGAAAGAVSAAKPPAPGVPAVSPQMPGGAPPQAGPRGFGASHSHRGNLGASEGFAPPAMMAGQRGPVPGAGCPPSSSSSRFSAFQQKGLGPQAPSHGFDGGAIPPTGDAQRLPPGGVGPSPPSAPFRQMNGYGGAAQPPLPPAGQVAPPSSAFGSPLSPPLSLAPALSTPKPPAASPSPSPFLSGGYPSQAPPAGAASPSPSYPPQGAYPPPAQTPAPTPSAARPTPPQGPMPSAHGVSPLGAGAPAPSTGAALARMHPASAASASPPPHQMTLPQGPPRGAFPPSAAGVQPGRMPSQGGATPCGAEDPTGSQGSLGMPGVQPPSPYQPSPPVGGVGAGGVPTLQQQQAEEKPVAAYSAPTVGAQPIKPGMPVPWPIPTSAQLNSRATKSTYAANVNIHKATEKPDGAGTPSPPMPAEKQAYIQRVISQLLQLQTGAAANDLSQKMEELFSKMRAGELSASGGQRLLQLCELLEQQQYVQAQKVHAELSSTEWAAGNKAWLMGLKRLLPKP